MREYTSRGGAINCLAAVAGEGRVVFGDVGGRMFEMDVYTDKVLNEWRPHTGPYCIASAGGDRVLSGARNGPLCLWNLRSKRCERKIQVHVDVKDVCVFPDLKRAATCGWQKEVHVWDMKSGKCLKMLTGHTDAVFCVKVFDEGRRLVSSSRDHTIRVWGVDGGGDNDWKCIRVLKGHTGWINSVCVVGGGMRVVSGSADHTVRVWDINSGECLRVLKGHDNIVTSVVSLGDDRRVVSGGVDTTLRVWDIVDGECLQVLQGHTATINTMCCLANGSVVSGSWCDTVRVWS